VQVLGSRAGRGLCHQDRRRQQAALFAASVEVLDQLGWLDDIQRAALAPWRAQALVNARGLRVGERKPVFKLQTP